MSPIAEKVASSIVGAVLLTGGGAVITNWHHNGVQDEQINDLRQDFEAQSGLAEQLQETNKNLAVLNERLEWVIREGRKP